MAEKETSTTTKVVGGLIAGLVVGAGGVALTGGDIDSAQLATDVASQIEITPVATLTQEQIIEAVKTALSSGEEIPADIQEQLDFITDEVTEEDNFEIACEVLAEEETKERSFLRDLTDFLNDEGFDIESWKDIEDVSIRDNDVTKANHRSGDCRVDMRTKVSFEDDTANEELRETVYIRFDIDDNEIDDVEFSLEEF